MKHSNGQLGLTTSLMDLEQIGADAARGWRRSRQQLRHHWAMLETSWWLAILIVWALTLPD